MNTDPRSLFLRVLTLRVLTLLRVLSLTLVLGRLLLVLLLADGLLALPELVDIGVAALRGGLRGVLQRVREHRDELERDVQRKTARLQEEIAERTRAEREIVQISNREQRRFAYALELHV